MDLSISDFDVRANNPNIEKTTILDQKSLTEYDRSIITILNNRGSIEDRIKDIEKIRGLKYSEIKRINNGFFSGLYNVMIIGNNNRIDYSIDTDCIGENNTLNGNKWRIGCYCMFK